MRRQLQPIKFTCPYMWEHMTLRHDYTHELHGFQGNIGVIFVGT